MPEKPVKIRGGPRTLAARLAVAAGLAATAGLADAAGAAAQEAGARTGATAQPPTALRHADLPCADLPVHTAALAERLHMVELGALMPSGDRQRTPVAAAWSPEMRLSDQVRGCIEGDRVVSTEMVRTGPIRLGFLPAAIELRHTTGYPRTMTDGSFRPGVGMMAGVVAGFVAGLGPVTLVVRPEIHHHRNSRFDVDPQSIPGHSRFIQPRIGTRIDLPQRFGNEPFGGIYPGQTTLRLDWRAFAGGASTENAWWGPGLRNPLLLSSAGPGLPHVFLGTSRPVDIRIGKLFLRTMVGRATESEFFDGDPDNDHRLLSGTIASFEPAPLPGLTLGAARFFAMADGPDMGVGPFLRAAITGPGVDPATGLARAHNEYTSVFARWAVPAAGVAAYGELVRTDPWWEWFQLAPPASRAWMAGIQKVFQGDASSWRIMAEAASLVDPMPSLLPGRFGNEFWYTHSQLRQGHTHRGQLLGAPIGPGGRAQVVAIDRYAHGGDLGLELSRAVYNDDSYYQVWWIYYNVFGNDAELSALLRARRPVDAFDLHAGLGYRHRWNRQSLGLAELVGTAWLMDELRREGSWYVELRAVWTGR